MSSTSPLPPTPSSDLGAPRASLSSQVADAILDLIVEESLETGALLPSEARLAERFNVSRVVVREACRSLQAQGILDVQHGKGMFVTNWSADTISTSLRFALRRDSRLYDDLLEARFSLEVQAAELAAQRATPEQLEDLRAALHATEAALEDFELLARADVAFHDAIFAASGNQVLAFFGAGMQPLLVDGRRLTYAGSLYRGETAQVALRDHRRLLRAIEGHDVAGARQAMIEHLNMTRDVLLEAQKRTSTLPGPIRTEDILALALSTQRSDATESPGRVEPAAEPGHAARGQG